MDGLLAGRRALVTGASSGIGGACARAFASRGTRVLLAARRRERLDALRAELEAAGAAAHAFTLDVRDKAQVAALEREVHGLYQVIDVAGGIGEFAAIDEREPTGLYGIRKPAIVREVIGLIVWKR